MANRIYFANQQVAFRPVGSPVPNFADGKSPYAPTWNVAHGVQSVAVTTTFNLEQAFELGQLAIYENIEGVPDIEITMSKVLDGYPLLYTLGTDENSHTNSHGPDLAGRSNASVMVALGVWPDTDNSAEASPSQQMEASGMFCSAISYNFPIEDNFSEDITLVGNNKGWIDMAEISKDGAGAAGTGAVDCTAPGWQMALAQGAFTGNADGPLATGVQNVGWATGNNVNTQPRSTTTSETFDQRGGVNRRENLSFAPIGVGAGMSSLNGAVYLATPESGADYCRLPTEIPGVGTSGWINPSVDSANQVHIQSISVSTDLGREELFELGTRQPYARVVTFPIEVTCDIEVLSLSGDMINAFADGCTVSTDPCTGIQDNLSNQSIRIATCEGTRLYLGSQNKLSSVNYGGGDAGGGNVTVTYSYTNFNDLTIMHPQDPNVSGTGWWGARSGYLQQLQAPAAGQSTYIKG
mgnify:CR=1 FL=1